MNCANTNRSMHAASGVKRVACAWGIEFPVGLSFCMQGVKGPADPLEGSDSSS